MEGGKEMRIRFTDNSSRLLNDMGNKKEEALFNIGLKWQEVVKKIITDQEEVDTGRMRASMSFITNKRKGPNVGASNSQSKDFLSGASGDDGRLIVGSNVGYARWNEFHNKKGAFLKPSLLRSKEDFKRIAESVLRR